MNVQVARAEMEARVMMASMDTHVSVYKDGLDQTVKRVRMYDEIEFDNSNLNIE